MTVLVDTKSPITEGLLFAERSRLMKLCLRLTGDQQLAEDLTQETLLIGWQQQDQLRDQSRRIQWLNGIARNLCRGWLRRQQTLHHVEDGNYVADDPHLEKVPDAFDLDEELEQSEFAQVLDQALACLPTMTSTVLVDRYIHGLPMLRWWRLLMLCQKNHKRLIWRFGRSFCCVLNWRNRTKTRYGAP